jgi:hypothetical protein
MSDITLNLGSWYDIIICRWKLKRMDYNDTNSNADTACKTVGFSDKTSFSPSWLSSATNNQTFYQYMNYSNCGRYLHFFNT